MIWWVFLIKTCFCFWLDWLFPPESPLRIDSSIWLEVRSLSILAATGLKLVMAVSVFPDCFSDRGTAVSDAIIPISRNLWSHQSLWQPCRPPTSALVCKASLEKLNLCFFPFTPRYLVLQLGAPAPYSTKLLCTSCS